MNSAPQRRSANRSPISSFAISKTFGMAALLAVIASPANAAREDEAVLLARVAVSEAGWSNTHEHRALWHVLAARADSRSTSLASMTRAYSRRAIEGSERKPWLGELDASGRTPASWNVPVGFVAYRSQWLEVVEQARRFVRGEVDHNPCPGAMHWGDRSERVARRAESLGLVEVRCTHRMGNRFFRHAPSMASQGGR